MTEIPEGQRYDSSMEEADEPRELGDGNSSSSGTGVASGLHLGRLGLRIQGVTPEEILNDSDFYADLLTKHQAIGFKHLHPTIEQHVEILGAIYRGDDDKPPSEGNIINIDHAWMKATNPLNTFENSEDFIKGNWHLDNPFIELPPSLQSMRMDIRTDNVGNDDTMVVSLEYLYEIMPENMKEYLKGIEIVHSLGSDPETHHGEDELTSLHFGKSVTTPALRTHPVTGKTSFWFNPTECIPVGGHTEQWGEIKAWMFNELQKPELRFRWSWDVGDLFIWDNRNLIHAFSPEFKVGERVFTRYEVGIEKPYYDPEKFMKIETTPNTGNPPKADQKTATTKFSSENNAPERDDWASAIANPDHIPLVLTKGIYALPEFEHLIDSVTVFFISRDEFSNAPDGITALWESVQGEDWAEQDEPREPKFNVVKVPFDENHILVTKYAPFWNPETDPTGQIFLFTRNGDISRAYKSTNDPMFEGCAGQVAGMLSARRDLRHAGHAWHYPDFMSYPSHQERPFRWENLPFARYADFDGDPPKDFLVQFAIDTIYGCFNHLNTDESREEIVKDIRDFLNIMLEMNAHEFGR